MNLLTRNNEKDRNERLHRRARRIEWFIVSYNVLEAAVAVTAGVVAGSAALMSFGLDSGIEVTAASIVLWRLYKAGPNASGQRRARSEKWALYFIAVTFVLLAGYIVFESIQGIVQQKSADDSPIGLTLAGLSILIMPVAGWLKYRTGCAMESEALKADAIETFVCVYLSFALLAGVGLNMAFGWWWSDTAGALAMLPVILWQAWQTYKEARENE